MISNQCFNCLHFNLSEIIKENVILTCTAFPEGIPDDIISGKVSHESNYRGDGGIVRTPIAFVDGKIQVLSLSEERKNEAGSIAINLSPDRDSSLRDLFLYYQNVNNDRLENVDNGSSEYLDWDTYSTPDNRKISLSRDITKRLNLCVYLAEKPDMIFHGSFQNRENKKSVYAVSFHVGIFLSGENKLLGVLQVVNGLGTKLFIARNIEEVKTVISAISGLEFFRNF